MAAMRKYSPETRQGAEEADAPLQPVGPAPAHRSEAGDGGPSPVHEMQAELAASFHGDASTISRRQVYGSIVVFCFAVWWALYVFVTSLI